MKTSFILPMMFATLAHADEKSVSIDHALKKGIISAEIKGKGGHLGDVISLKIKNKSTLPVQVFLEAGRVLDSQDTVEQNMIVTHPATISLLAKQERTVDLSAMCCKAHRSSPDKDDVFVMGMMADSNLVKLSEYIDLNKWHKSSVAQNAVWILSDNNPMERIGGEDSISKKLQRFVSKLTGKQIPKYKMHYPDNSGIAYYAVPTEISGTFDYEMHSNGEATFGVYDANGQAVAMFFVDVPRNKGTYYFNYSFKTSNLPRGNYYARLRIDGQVKKEQRFTF